MYFNFQKTLTTLVPEKKATIAFSGGVDSMVLLHLCVRLRQQDPRWDFSAIHVDHQLQADSRTFRDYCETCCRDLNIQLITLTVRLDQNPGNRQARARAARLNAFEKALEPPAILLLAHHQQDQAETVLMRLLKGAGSLGLSGMKPSSQYRTMRLVRPLLTVSQEAILAYAQAQQLNWCEDPSNQSDDYDRNFIRHQIWPVLKQRWPASVKNIATSATLCYRNENLIQNLSDQYYIKALGSQPGTLSIAQLRSYSQDLYYAVIRFWLKSKDLNLPSVSYLDRLKQEVLLAKSDRNPILTLDQFVFRRYQDNLYLLPKTQPAKPQEYDLKHKKWGHCSIKFYGQSAHGKTIKKFFQSHQIPPWERPFVGLVYQGARFMRAMALE